MLAQKISAQQLFCITCSLLAVLYVLHELLCTTTYQPAVPPFYTSLVAASAPAILCKALLHGFFHRGCFALLHFALRSSCCLLFSAGFAPAVLYHHISQTALSHSFSFVLTACFLLEALLV